MMNRALLALAPLHAAQAAVGLGAIALFTRLMTAEQFGHYAIALSLSMLVHTLLFTCLEAAAFRFWRNARESGRAADHFATLIAAALCLGAALLLFVFAALRLIGASEETFAIAMMAAGSAVLRVGLRISRESERAALQIGRYATFESIYLLVGFAGGVACLTLFELGAAAPFAGLVAAGAVVLLLDLPRLCQQARGGAPSLQRAASYAAYGGPLALALSIDLAVQALVRIVLAAQAGTGEVAAYAAAFGLARPIDLLFMSLGAALSPVLLTAYERNGQDGARAAAGPAFASMLALTLPAAVGLALVAVPLSAVLVGPSLSAEAARILPWLALAGLLSGVNLYYFSEAFQLTRRTGLRALIMLAPGGVQLAFTMMLAGPYGAMGAAIAAAAGACVGAALLFIVGRQLLALPVRLTTLARTGLATALMASAVMLTGGADLPLRIAIGVLVYATAALALDVAGVRALAGAHLWRLRARLMLSTDLTHAR